MSTRKGKRYLTGSALTVDKQPVPQQPPEARRPSPKEIIERFGKTIVQAANGVSPALRALIPYDDRVQIGRVHVIKNLRSLDHPNAYVWRMVVNAIKDHSKKLLKQTIAEEPSEAWTRGEPTATKQVKKFRVREGQAPESRDDNDVQKFYDGNSRKINHDDALDHVKANHTAVPWLNITSHRSWMTNPEECAARMEEADRRAAAVNRLTEEEARTLMQTVAEIAARLNISIDAAESRQRRARAKLRTLLAA